MQITQRFRNTDKMAVIVAFALAALAGAILWFLPPMTSGDRIDLESLIPIIGDSVTGPGSGGSTQEGVAGLILIAVAAVTGLPLIAPRSAERRVLVVCASVVTLFTLATILRNGLFYVPSAALLTWVVLRPTPRVTTED
jgi:hypothetical protein